MKQSGFFDLQTPRDLLEKARHDLDRLRAKPDDAYAAFDFFVAVRHLPDWLHPGDDPERKERRRELFDGSVELRVARHIADGAKHFEATHPHNQQVQGTSIEAAFQAVAFQTNAFQGRRLIIRLDRRDPETALLGDWVDALEFAEKVFEVAKSVIA